MWSPFAIAIIVLFIALAIAIGGSVWALRRPLIAMDEDPHRTPYGDQPLVPMTDRELVGPCHFSPTGFAIVLPDGRCTCRPAPAPAPAVEVALRAHDERLPNVVLHRGVAPRRPAGFGGGVASASSRASEARPVPSQGRDA